VRRVFKDEQFPSSTTAMICHHSLHDALPISHARTARAAAERPPGGSRKRLSALDYEELVRELFPRLTGGIRWGLERTRALLSAVGDPHTAYATIHVGGTNGKGSVAATIAGILHAAGHRTGLYSSPHLTTFRERIRID